MGFFDFLFGKKQPSKTIQPTPQPEPPMPIIESDPTKPKRYRKPKYQYDRDYYQIICALDDETCSKCGKMDLRIYPEDEKIIGENCPPFHDGCRCATVPWFGDDNIGQRAARDHEGRTIYVDASMTHSQWRKKYGRK